MPVNMVDHNMLDGMQGLNLKEPTGMIENFNASEDVMRKQESWYSPFFYREMYDARDKQLDDFMEQGLMPEATQYNLGGNRTAQAQWFKEMGHDIETDEDLDKLRRKAAEKDKQAMAETAASASGWGKVGMFAGAIKGSITAVDILTYPLAGYALISKTASLTKVLGTTMAITTGIETVRERVVQKNAYELGQPKSTAEMVKNVGYAVTGDLLLTGAGITAGKMSQYLRKLAKTDGVDRAAAGEIDNAIREMDSGLDPNAVSTIEKVDGAAKQYEEFIAPADLDDLHVRQQQTRIEELKGKKALTDLEADELELARTKPTPKGEAKPGETAHPADELAFLDDADKQYLKDNGAVADEVAAARANGDYDSWIKCAIGNGITI